MYHAGIFKLLILTCGNIPVYVCWLLSTVIILLERGLLIHVGMGTTYHPINCYHDVLQELVLAFTSSLLITVAGE